MLSSAVNSIDLKFHMKQKNMLHIKKGSELKRNSLMKSRLYAPKTLKLKDKSHLSKKLWLKLEICWLV